MVNILLDDDENHRHRSIFDKFNSHCVLYVSIYSNLKKNRNCFKIDGVTAHTRRILLHCTKLHQLLPMRYGSTGAPKTLSFDLCMIISNDCYYVLHLERYVRTYV